MSQSSVVQKIVDSTPSAVVAHPQMSNSRDRQLGAMLVDRGRLTGLQVERILLEQKKFGLRFGETAVQLGFITAKDLEDVLAQQFGYPFLEPTDSSLPTKVTAAFNPASPFVEALRGLRGQLLLRWFDGSPGQTALAVTSVDRGDGKSFITANLGVVFSQLGERTLVIDADLRHPTQHQNFGIRNEMGLAGVLSGRASLEEIVRIPNLANLSVLPSGPLPPNPQELLGRQEFVALLNQLSAQYDVILVDTPSAQEASDAQVVAQRTRAALLVGRKDKTKSTELAQLASIMGSSGISILGATLNEY